MFLQLDQKSAFLGRKPAGFTETYYTEWDDGLGKSKISLFLVLAISSSHVPGAEIGKEAFQLLQDHYLDDLSGDPYDRFENALREVNLMINEKEKILEKKFIPNMNVICGVIEKDMLFLSQRGDAQGYLLRKRHVSSITEGLFDEKNTEDLFQNIASGVLEVNDSVLLVTGKLVQYATPGEISKIFSEQSLSEAMKELDDMLSSDIEEQMAMLSFEVLEKTEGKAIAPVEESEFKKQKKSDNNLEKFGKARWVKPIHILREWAFKQEGPSFMSRLSVIKTWGRDKLLIGIVAGTVVLVGGSAALGYYLIQSKSRAALAADIATAEDNINQAGTVGSYDKEKASGLLDYAEELAVKILNTGKDGGKASELLDKINEQRDFLDNIVRIDDEAIKLADFSSVLGAGEKLMGLSNYKDRIVAYSDIKIYQVLIDQVQNPSELSKGDNAVAGTYFADQEKMLFLMAGGNLVAYQDGNIQFADNADGTWKSGNALTTYSTKFYILDAINNQIWKYTQGRDSFSAAQAYFKTGSQPDLSKAVDFAIDGSVWVLSSDGTLSKYLSGEAVEFETFKAPLGTISSASKIYTELDLNSIYVLDSGENSIYVYTKSHSTDDITYETEYKVEVGDGEIKDIYFDRVKSMLYFVTESALYEIKL